MKRKYTYARTSALVIAFMATSLLSYAEGNRCCLDAVSGRVGSVAGPHTQDLVETSPGSGVTLPTVYMSDNSCSEWLFAGWHAASPVNATTTAPTLIPAGSYTPSSNGEKLYAVYRDHPDTYRWEKITDVSEIEVGGEYVFVVDSNKNAISVNGVTENNRLFPHKVTVTGKLITGGLTNYEIWRGVDTSGLVMFKNEQTGYYLAYHYANGSEYYHVPTSDNDDDEFYLKQHQGSIWYLKYYPAVKAFRQTQNGDHTPFHIYKKILTTYTSSPDCLPKMEVVGWDEDDSGNRYVTVESYVLHGAPTMTHAVGEPQLQSDGTYRIQFDPAQLPPCSEAQIAWDGTTTTLRVPYIIKNYEMTSSLMGAKGCDTCDVYVMSHGEILINDNRSLNMLTVHDGGYLSVSNNKTLTVNSLILFAEGDQSAPAVNLNMGGHIVLANDALYYDLRIPQYRWYWFTVPYDVSSRELSYACEAANGGIPVYRTDYWVKYYNGAKRASDANSGSMNGTYWTHMAKAGQDYLLHAGNGYQVGINDQDTVHFNGQDYTHINRTMRFTMHPDPATWNTSESGGTKTTPVVPSRVNNPGNASHAGWNLIGNPYLHYYNLNEVANSGQLRSGAWTKIMDGDEWTGYWQTDEEEEIVPYLTVYDPDTKTYSQELVYYFRELRPFEAVFVQVGEDSMLNFLHPDIIKSPKLLRATKQPSANRLYTGITLSGCGQTDRAGIVLDEDLTTEYEVGADLCKMGNEKKLNLYTLNAYHNMLGFNALSDSDALAPIPVGMVVFNAGTYTFAFDAEQYSTNALESLQLIDYVTGTETDLLHDTYTFDAAEGGNESRFALLLRRANRIPTDLTSLPIGEGRGEAVKVLRNGALFIRLGDREYNARGLKVK